MNRRMFVRMAVWVLGGLAVWRLWPFGGRAGMCWQIDPRKCVQCGRCATHCVLGESAVKCVRLYASCGYCDFCSGYFQDSRVRFDSAAENQRCPMGAIRRTLIEDPYFKYCVDEALCNGCGKCVKGCWDFGNGSMILQIKQELCKGCNECAIARACPANAIRRVSTETPYAV